MNKHDPRMKKAVAKRRKVDGKLFDLCVSAIEGQEAPTVIDIGAFKGKFLGAIKARVPAVKCYGVEPDEENCAMLRDAGYTVWSGVAWPIETTCTVYISSKGGKKDTSIYRSSAEKLNNKIDHEVKVKAKNIGDILDEFGLKEVDVMLMNCEGAEYNLLLQNTEWLGRVRHLYLHLHTKSEEFLGNKYIEVREAICKDMAKNGFTLLKGMTDMRAIAHIVQLWKRK